MRCSRTQALRTYAALPSLLPSFPSGRFGAVGRRPLHNTASLKPYSTRSVVRSLGRMQKHHHHRLRPPSGSANMAQTDELVLAFAFASASKWGSEIDAEEEGGSPGGCLPDSSLIYVHARWHERVSFSSARVRVRPGAAG